MSLSSFQPDDTAGLPEAESLGDGWVPQGCSSDEAVALAGVEIQRHLRGIPLYLHSLASLRKLHECVEPWLLRACPALLKRFVEILHNDARRTPEANTVLIDNREYVFLHDIDPRDWRTLEIRLQPLTGPVRWRPAPRRIQIPNITKVRLLVPSTLSGFDPEAALDIVKRTLEFGYTCVLDSLSDFTRRTPWSALTSSLYAHLASCANRIGIDSQVVENLGFGALIPADRAVYLLSPQKVAQIVHRVASDSGSYAYSPLRKAVEIICSNLPLSVTHGRHLGSRVCDPVPRCFSDSDYHRSMVAGEIALYGGNDFALVGAVASANRPALWCAVRLDQAQAAARLFEEAKGFLTRAATTIGGRLPEAEAGAQVESPTPPFDPAPKSEVSSEMVKLSWNATACDLEIGKPNSVITPDGELLAIPDYTETRLPRYELVLAGETWTVRFGREEGSVKATNGARYVAELLRRPHRSITVGQLLRVHPRILQGATGIPYPILDEKARAAVNNRRRALLAEPEMSPAMLEEIEQIEIVIERATTPDGRSRSFGYRKPIHAVRTAIRRFMHRLSKDQFGEFRHHLFAHIATSYPFTYDPPTDFPEWVIR